MNISRCLADGELDEEMGEEDEEEDMDTAVEVNEFSHYKPFIISTISVLRSVQGDSVRVTRTS